MIKKKFSTFSAPFQPSSHCNNFGTYDGNAKISDNKVLWKVFRKANDSIACSELKLRSDFHEIRHRNISLLSTGTPMSFEDPPKEGGSGGCKNGPKSIFRATFSHSETTAQILC